MSDPERWTIRSIGEICDRVTSGGTPSRARREFYVNGDIPWVKTGELRDQYIESSEEKITTEAVRESSAKLLPRNTVLMAMYGATVGALGILNVAATCNQASCAMVVDPSQASARWLFYALVNDRDRIVSMATGAAQQNLSGKTIRGFEYSTPPLLEQRAIAEVLGALDDKIAANARLADTLRELALSMTRISTPRTSLGNVVLHHKSQVNPAELSQHSVEHFSLPAFDAGRGPDIADPSTIKSNKFVVHAPAILVSKLNPQTPRVWPVTEVTSATQLASTEFLVLQPFVCSPLVMWAILSQPEFVRDLEGKVAGTSGSHQRVRPADLLAAPILDPRMISSQLIADVDEVLAPVGSLEQENRTLAATRDALLPKLMSGQLRVRDVTDDLSEVPL